MSDDDSSGSSSDGEDINTTGLIATRAKRATAGNLYATLRDNLDDEEFQKELLAEDEEDVGDYEGSDKEDDDEAMDSSSDEEDAGPPKAGEQEDLDGELELKRAERAAAKKKRKLEQAKMRLPAWQKKRVKLADDAKTDDGVAQRPKKKSERANWLPSAADMPVRQSHRSSAITNREIIHANLKQSAARSEKQRKLMKNAADRERAHKRADFTQEQRMARVAKIEKETEKEFGRWEREEAERQRIREEQLAAKRKRAVDAGPTISHWSGSVVWEGEKIKIPRVKAKSLIEEVTEEDEKKLDTEASTLTADVEKAEPAPDGPSEAGGDPARMPLQDSQPAQSTTETTAQASQTQESNIPPEEQTPNTDVPWLDGIQAYAAQPVIGTQSQTETQNVVDSVQPEGFDQQMTDAPIDAEETCESANQQGLADQEPQQEESVQEEPQQEGSEQEEPQQEENQPEQTQQPELQQQEPEQQDPHQPDVQQPEVQNLDEQHQESQQEESQQQELQQPSASSPLLHAQTSQQASLPLSVVSFQTTSQPFSDGSQSTQQLSVSTQPPPPPAAPLLREQAQRSLVLLTHFSNLDAAPTRRSSKYVAKSLAALESVLNAAPVLGPLVPSSHPAFTVEEARYLTTKMKKHKNEHYLPPAPTKPKCALTAWPAKYRDPKTGLPYADLQTYKMIQRLLAGGCAWSGFLGAWVGPWYGETGRPARGVPAGFGG